MTTEELLEELKEYIICIHETLHGAVDEEE